VVTNTSIMSTPWPTVTASLPLQTYNISKIGIKPKTMLMTYLALYQVVT